MPTSPVYKRKDRVHELPCVVKPASWSNTGICWEKKGVYNIAQEFQSTADGSLENIITVQILKYQWLYRLNQLSK